MRTNQGKNSVLSEYAISPCDEYIRLSNSLIISIDDNEKNNEHYPFECIIPRDVNMKILEFISTNKSLSYLIIYKFDSNENFTERLALFCSNDDIEYPHLFINNISITDQNFIAIGVREIDEDETYELCILENNNIQINDYSVKFTSNYKYRYYSSPCFYRDEDKNWRNDGLTVCLFD